MKNVTNLKSSYSIRIYELLKQFERLKVRTFTLEDLRLKLGATDVYPQYGNFKQRILNPSKKEINKKSDIQIDFEEIKQGRSVHQIKFFIKPTNENLPIQQLEFLDEQKENSNQEVEEIKQLALKQGLNISEKMISEWLTYGAERVKEELTHIKYRDDIHNPIGFISYILKNKEYVEPVTVDPVQEVLQKIIKSHIPRKNVRKLDVLPDWYIEGKAIEELSTVVSSEEAHEIWSIHREEILNEINMQRKNALMR